MNDRQRKLCDRVLCESKVFALRDDHIRSLLAVADEDEKLRIIREEYAKIIETDEESLLAGGYPSVPFFERIEIDYSKIWESGNNNYEAYENKLFINGGNHFSADFETLLAHGLSGLMEQIEEKKKNLTEDKQKEFLEDLYYAARAITAWTQAFADALYAAAEKEVSKKRRDELLQTADICRRVPYLPATSFREAIQSYFFTFILFPDGLGCIDRYLYPYYKSDIEKGTLTREEALGLIEELFIKIFSFHGKDEIRSGNNHGVIAGYTKDGECGHNECTSLILEAITALPTWRPQVSYRVTAKTTAEQLREALEANTVRPDVIMFLNDDVIVNGLVSVGVEYEDAVGYSSSGCNETVLTGCSHPGALEGLINVMHSLECMLKDTDKLEDISSFDEFYSLYEGYLQRDLDIVFRRSFDGDSIGAKCPMILPSLLTSGCISSATPISGGGAKYNFCTWCLTGLINLADSLSIIRQMVFEENRFTLTELSRFLVANWAGYEDKRSYIVNNGRYFGNDDDYVDSLVNKVSASVNAFAKKYTPYRGGRYLFGTLTGYELSHISFGKISGASPDGRYATEPFAASISSFPGADKNGITAYLKSAAKISGELLQSSVVVNLQIDRALVDNEEKRDRLAAILRTYFNLGGIQLQINYLSADELIKAKEEPEKYRNLRVRVTGFSGFFTSFDEELQDEIIDRHLHTV